MNIFPKISARASSKTRKPSTWPPAAPHPPAHGGDALLRVLSKSSGFAGLFFARLRKSRLAFRDRVLCPFLRPLFRAPGEEQHVRIVAETIATRGERVVAAALED